MAPPNYQLFFSKIGSNQWNGNPAADPVTVVGGIDLSQMIGLTMFPTIQGSGDGSVSVNFGQSAFAGAVPSGYKAGWPTAGGVGHTTLSPSRLYGSAVLSGGNLIGTFNTVPGMAQAVDGHTGGAYYFEITNHGTDIFSNFQGGGVGQDYANGGNFSNWINSCAFNTGLPLGGGAFKGGNFNSWNAIIQALNASVVNPWTTFPSGTTVGVAVFLSPNPTAPPIVPQPVPSSLVRYRGQVGLNWKGMALIGDAYTNVVGLSDFENFTEYGNPMQFQITTPPIHEDRKRIFMPRFEIEVEAGDGEPDDPAAVPHIWLDWSKDGGKTWSTLQLPQSMGSIGQYIKRLRWMNLGNSRTWVFRLTCTDNVRRYIIGTYTTDYRSLG